MPVVTAAHREARREQILDAAAGCFAREGFHRATMQDIIGEAGLSTGAIYGYFAGKEEIVEAIADERHAREARVIDALSAGNGGGEAIRQVAVAFFASLADEKERRRRRVGVQVWAEALRNPRLLKIARRGVDNARQRFARVVRDAQERGELPEELDPDGAARVIVALFQGFVLQQQWDPRVKTEPYLRTIEVILDALVAQGRASQAREGGDPS
jgi:AcrR family transcriptional regulator